MSAAPCGPAPEEELFSKLDSLLEYLGEIESDVKDLRRRMVKVERETGLDRISGPMHYRG